MNRILRTYDTLRENYQAMRLSHPEILAMIDTVAIGSQHKHAEMLDELSADVMAGGDPIEAILKVGNLLIAECEHHGLTP